MSDTSPPPPSFEARISRVRLWTVLPVTFVPLLVWEQLRTRLPIPDEVSRLVFGFLLHGLLFTWWLRTAAPRPISVKAAMGRFPSLAGWRLVAVALLGMGCLRFGAALVPHGSVILAAFSTGGVFTYTVPDEASSWVKFLTVAVIPPITEELIFRGTLFRKWRVRWGPSLAALLTAALFAAWHHDYVGAFIGGLTYALVYTRTRSLWASVFMHAVHNGAVLSRDVLSELVDERKLIRLDQRWEYIAFALLLLIGIGLWLHFVVTSWRSLGEPLPPDSLQTVS